MRYLILIAALLLGACSGQTAETRVKTLQAVINTAQTAYDSGRILVAGYKALTPCGEPGAAKVCYDANVGQKADQLLGTLALAIVTAKGVDVMDTKVDVVGITATVTAAAVALIPALHQMGIL